MTGDRRRFLLATGVLGGAGALSLALPGLAADEKKDEEDISAPEDLMREHGVLNRLLLVYEEALRRLRGKDEVGPEVFQTAGNLIRKFVEDYHEKLEEDFIFPAFEKRGKQEELIKVLRKQHKAGREVTALILHHAEPDRFRKEGSRKALQHACEAFIRMYRPHEAREDTVLFPALYKVMPAKEIRDLGDMFEKQEDKILGKEGFEKTVEQVATLEKQLGIFDLDKFTPRVGKE